MIYGESLCSNANPEDPFNEAGLLGRRVLGFIGFQETGLGFSV